MSDQKVCANCSRNFRIFPIDAEYYSRIDVPHPSWCPRCRHLRRHGHINDYVFFQRSCDNCQKPFVSIFPAGSPYKVFCQDCWYSEERDDKAQGREFDFSRPFFEQFDELMHEAPQLGIIGMNNINSSYSESVANCKNVYLISESSNCEDCSFCYWIQKTVSTFDSCYLHECEECYEVSDCFNCYNLRYSQNCTNCSDSYFLDNCKSCSHCAFCTNLRQKKFCIFNEQFSEEEYRQRLAEFDFSSYSSVAELRERFFQFIAEEPRKHLQMEQTENCTGDYVRNAKNCRSVYHCYDAEDCAYGEHVWRGAKDCFDANTAGRDAELIYESTNSGISSYNVKFSRYCWGCHNTEYSNQCKSGSNLFGCVSLKPKASNCILNKQYSKEDFASLRKQIKEHMLETGEYGEFLPLSISMFGYNTSVSFDDERLERDEVLRRGWKWEETAPGTFGKGTLQAAEMPDDPCAVDEKFCSEVLTCESCMGNYRVVKHELKFYQKRSIPLPLECPSCRQRARLNRRPKKELIDTSCAMCGARIETTLDPETYAKIYCRSCYEKALY